MKEIIEKITREVEGPLAQGDIDGFLALKRWGEGHVAPFMFTRVEELKDLDLGDPLASDAVRYPLVDLLRQLVKRFPKEKFALLVRGCEERAIRRMMADSRDCVLNPERLFLIGFSCPSELAEKHQCVKPWPDMLVAGEKTPGVEAPAAIGDDPFAQLEEWFGTINRCVKCFGCRNVCPVCDCGECTMELEALVPQRELPVDRSFLMTRAMHMVDRCVYCGLCEEACPADIPLMSLYRLVAGMTGNNAVKEPPKSKDLFVTINTHNLEGHA